MFEDTTKERRDKAMTKLAVEEYRELIQIEKKKIETSFEKIVIYEGQIGKIQNMCIHEFEQKSDFAKECKICGRIEGGL